MAENMAKKGYAQGDMAPKVSDYQKSESQFPERQPGKTTEYIARQNRVQNEMSKDVSKQHYKGRYS